MEFLAPSYHRRRVSQWPCILAGVFARAAPQHQGRASFRTLPRHARHIAERFHVAGRRALRAAIPTRPGGAPIADTSRRAHSEVAREFRYGTKNFCIATAGSLAGLEVVDA